MTLAEREHYGDFIRLDEDDPELSAASGVKVYAISAPANSELMLQLLLDPRSVLLEGGVIANDDAGKWRITANRVNAQVSLPVPTPPYGPGWHHLVCIWTVIEEWMEAHGIFYRVPPPAA